MPSNRKSNQKACRTCFLGLTGFFAFQKHQIQPFSHSIHGLFILLLSSHEQHKMNVITVITTYRGIVTGRQARPNDAKGVLVPKKTGHFNPSFRVGLITAPWTPLFSCSVTDAGIFCVSARFVIFSGFSHFFHFDCQLLI